MVPDKGKVPEVFVAMKCPTWTKVPRLLGKLKKNKAINQAHPRRALYAEETSSTGEDTGTSTFPRAPNTDKSQDNEEARLPMDRGKDKEDLLQRE